MLEYCYSGTDNLWCGNWNRHVCHKWNREVDRPSRSTEVNQFNNTSWVVIVTLTDSPQLVRNRCVIDVLVVCLCLMLRFGFVCGCRGFCHTIEYQISSFFFFSQQHWRVLLLRRSLLQFYILQLNLLLKILFLRFLWIECFSSRSVFSSRPKSVCNRCVIELFCGVVCVVTLPFWHFCCRMGFCNKTESDLFLFPFLTILNQIEIEL